jgi:hypothetical protein
MPQRSSAISRAATWVARTSAASLHRGRLVSGRSPRCAVTHVPHWRRDLEVSHPARFRNALIGGLSRLEH